METRAQAAQLHLGLRGCTVSMVSAVLPISPQRAEARDHSPPNRRSVPRRRWRSRAAPRGPGPRATPVPPCLSGLRTAPWSPTRVSEEPCPRGPSRTSAWLPLRSRKGSLGINATEHPPHPLGGLRKSGLGAKGPGQVHPPSPLPRGRPGCQEMEGGPGGGGGSPLSHAILCRPPSRWPSGTVKKTSEHQRS